MENLVIKINKLKEIINKANHDYYVKNNVIITDAAFDRYFNELVELEKLNPELLTVDSPTQRVGGSIQAGFKSVNHIQPLLSIKTETDVTANGAINFDSRIRKQIDDPEYVAELKFDGLAINLTYINHILVSAVTRGDGQTGEDVLSNVRSIKQIPLSIPIDSPQTLEVRGEIYMSKDAFTKLNNSQSDKAAKLFSNPRNAAAGSLRQLDPNISRQRDLRFFAYSVGYHNGALPSTQYDILQQLSIWGFAIDSNTKICRNADELITFHKTVLENRDKIPFEIDGVVYKINKITDQEILGYSNREPKWSIAHKYPPQEETTTITGIDIQIGRTGKVTPVARLEPVFVGGVTVTNVTLHNQSEIDKKNIRIGDTVIVRRAGDVVPEIVCSILEKRPLNSVEFKVPNKCPVCNSDIVQYYGEINHICTGGLVCLSQLSNSVLHFCSKKAMNVEGLGPTIVNGLIDKKILKSVIDIYKLTSDKLLMLGGMGNKSISNILEAIEKSKITDLNRVILSIGIKHVGEKTAKDLADYFQNIDCLMSADYDMLINIGDIGEKTAKSIVDFFSQEPNKETIKTLLKLGVVIKKPPTPDSFKLRGLSFVVTGSLPSLSRTTVKHLVENNGGKLINNISKDVDFLLAGDGGGKKLTLANKNNVRVINEEFFLNLIK